MKKEIKVTENVPLGEKPVPVELVVQAILSISEGMKKMRSTRLNDRALCMLIAKASPTYGSYPKQQITASQVKLVFEGIESLEAAYLK